MLTQSTKVPCRRLRRGKGSSNMLRVQRWSLHWMRQLGVEV